MKPLLLVIVSFFLTMPSMADNVSGDCWSSLYRSAYPNICDEIEVKEFDQILIKLRSKALSDVDSGLELLKKLIDTKNSHLASIFLWSAYQESNHKLAKYIREYFSLEKPNINNLYSKASSFVISQEVPSALTTLAFQIIASDSSALEDKPSFEKWFTDSNIYFQAGKWHAYKINLNSSLKFAYMQILKAEIIGGAVYSKQRKVFECLINDSEKIKKWELDLSFELSEFEKSKR